MNYSQATHLWDAFEALKSHKKPSFRAENDKVFPDNILSPEQDKAVLEIMNSLNKGNGWETEGESGTTLKDSKVLKKSVKPEEGYTEDDQASAEDPILIAQSELAELLGQLEPKVPIPKEQRLQADPAPLPYSHVPDLLNYASLQLVGMKAFAAFAKDKFRDPELGIRYQKAFMRRIDKAMTVLSSYADYLSLGNPMRKANTINSLFEKVLTKHTKQLEDQDIEIIKKQFSEDLPETTVLEAQLEYILDSLLQYIVHSISPHGSLGALTRLVDHPKRTGERNDLLQEDRKYVEILLVFSAYDKKRVLSSPGHKGQGMELILLLVQEIIEKNNGFMEVKPSDKNPMAFISVKLPVERGNVVEFKPRW
jgi:hypothetical protein